MFVVIGILVVIGSNVTDTLPTVLLLCLSLGFAASSDGPTSGCPPPFRRPPLDGPGSGTVGPGSR